MCDKNYTVDLNCSEVQKYDEPSSSDIADLIGVTSDLIETIGQAIIDANKDKDDGDDK